MSKNSHPIFNWMPHILCAVFVLMTIKAMVPPKPVDGFDVKAFGSLPSLLNGRIQPIDSIARNSLLAIRAKSSVYLEKEDRNETDLRLKRKRLSATEWILEAMLDPETADTRKIFRIDHTDVIGMMGLDLNEKHHSFNEILAKVDAAGNPVNLGEVEKQAERVRDIEPQLRTPLDKQFANLHQAMGIYVRLRTTLRPGPRFWPENTEDWVATDFEEELEVLEGALTAGNRPDITPEIQQRVFGLLQVFISRYRMMDANTYPMLAPPLDARANPDAWSSIGKALEESIFKKEVHPAAKFYARISHAYRDGSPADFNKAISEYEGWLSGNGLQSALKKGDQEFLFSHMAPFYQSMMIYVAALLLGFVYWLNFAPWLQRSGFWLVVLAFIIHSIGLIFRMYLEGRPPVTNLYSSAVFVGWGAVGLGLILERVHRGAIGIAVASSIGFATLIIAHQLSLSGDTMEMLQAVLDTNFWLATHVVIITIGYSSMFIAGFLAIIYVVRGLFTTGLDSGTALALKRMVYGILCFATLFSFVGTVLGGIWADQSWGRFWGWDPKENGAMLIVIWCALVLHARWGGMIKDRGLMACAIFGNIVTSFSWFGVNMLGVGLHSYGFIDKAFIALMAFVASQTVFIGFCLVPLKNWKSFQKTPKSESSPVEDSGSMPDEGKALASV